jgi:hypothetical protein
MFDQTILDFRFTDCRLKNKTVAIYTKKYLALENTTQYFIENLYFNCIY